MSGMTRAVNVTFAPRFAGFREGAVDSAGDLFLTDSVYAGVGAVLEFCLQRTPAAYGPQTTLPTSGLYEPRGLLWTAPGMCSSSTMAVATSVWQELPRTATAGYGPQTTLPVSGLIQSLGIAMDSVGDIFLTDSEYGSAGSAGRVLELPKTSKGYGRQTTLPVSGLSGPDGIAVDRVGDLFISDAINGREVELQTRSVSFRGVNVCATGRRPPGHAARRWRSTTRPPQAALWQLPRCSLGRARPRFRPGQWEHLYRRRCGGRCLHSEWDLYASGHGDSEGLG